MSKCDIVIRFDRPDRQYRGGDLVRGTVQITVNQDVRCNGITLTHFWKTHGRGNSDRGPIETVMLAEAGQLTVGTQLQSPFEITAPCQPLSYHGENLNIDHYVKVDVDVPWAFNPKLEEEYLVVPGQPPPESNLATTKQISSYAQLGDRLRSVPPQTKLVSGIILFIVLMFCPFFWLIVPVLAIGVAVYLIRRQLLSRSLGRVTLETPTDQVAPGALWPLTLDFTPPRDLTINGITAQLVGREVCVSGSGTNRRTHTHKLHEQTFSLSESAQLTAGKPVNLQSSIPIPTTTAYTFNIGSDNRIEWEAKIRIDIPRRPDWTKKEIINLVPLEFQLASIGTEDAQPARTIEVPLSPAEPVFPAEPVVQSIVLATAVSSDPQQFASLADLLQAMSAADRSGSERQQMVESHRATVFSPSIEIDRVMTTYRYFDDKRLNNGRTITGKIAGTELHVQVFAAEQHNDHLDDAVQGTLWQSQFVVSKWDTLYDRAELLEVGSG